MKSIVTICVLLLATTATSQHGWRDLLDAIKQVETGSGSGIGVKGDGGRAWGPLQIHRAYFVDSRVKGKHAQCLTSRSFSESVVRGYMRRWSPAEAARLDRGAASAADCARVSRQHNGGPRGHTKQATLRYWSRVRALLGGKS